jgi:hypothetical protein
VRQQKGITSNVTRPHSTALTGTTTSLNHALWQPLAHRIRVRDEEHLTRLGGLLVNFPHQTDHRADKW